MSKPVLAALPKACAACPWRLSNQGMRHAGGWYTPANLRRLWRGLRNGERMTCHPTDPRMNECFGGEGTVKDDAVTHECTGSLIVAQREMMVLQGAYHSNPKEYARGRPGGVTTRGFVAMIERYVFGGAFDGLPASRPDLTDPDVGYPPLAGWEEAARRAE